MRSQQLLALYIVLTVGFIASQEQQTVSNSDCPQECVCYRELTTVKCQESSFTDLPRIARNLAGRVEVLDMSGSQIQSLKSASLSHFPRLKRLILRNNKISTVDTTSLGNAPVLEDLDLRGNDLKRLSRGLFSDSKLKVLYLADNPFSCDPSSVQVLLSEVKALMSENTGLEMFDGGLLRCAEPPNMKDEKLVHLLDADAEKWSSSHRAPLKPSMIVGVVSGVIGLVSSLIGAVFIILKRRTSHKYVGRINVFELYNNPIKLPCIFFFSKYHYDFLTPTEDEEDEEPNNEHIEDGLANKLKKLRRQSQGYPSQDIIDSEEEEAVDQDSYIKEKMKSQRRHSMGYSLENESGDAMEDIDLQST
ncbi:hypothetical protein QZH41_008544 [Actinostola sp. cb2023]|nr:hypothetical protein QZH41_008544 [Actinostola sp. cb2023]